MAKIKDCLDKYHHLKYLQDILHEDEQSIKKIEYCNIPNFGPTIYRHEPIDHDDYIDVLFYVGSKTPLHMNMMIVLYIGHKPIVDDIYVYIYVGCVGCGP